MHRIDDESATLELPEYLPVGTPGYFDYGNALTETLPTQMHHDFLNDLQENICYAIEQLGVALDKNNQHQLYAALQEYIAIGPEGGGSGLSSVQGDNNPKLGGNLIVNNHQIINSVGDITISPHGTGSIDFNKTNLNIKKGLGSKYDLTTQIEFGTDTQTFKVTNNNILDINSSGLRLGGINARVNSILDDDTMAANSAVALTTQRAGKKYADDKFLSINKKYLYIIPGNSSGAQFEASGCYFIGGPGDTAFTPITYVALPINKNATLSNLKFKSSDVWNISDSTVIVATLYVNGVATALTISMLTSAGVPDTEDTTNSVSVVAGDLIEVNLGFTGSPSVVPRINTAEVTIKIT